MWSLMMHIFVEGIERLKSYYYDANTLKEKMLKGISVEEVYKLEFNCIDETKTFYNLFAKVT